MKVALALLFLAWRLHDDEEWAWAFSTTPLHVHQHRSFRSLTRRNELLLFPSSLSFVHIPTCLYHSWPIGIDEDFINGDGIQQWCDPATIVFEDSETANHKLRQIGTRGQETNDQKETTVNEKNDKDKGSTVNSDDNDNGAFPYALMMQVSAPYIASHANKVAVFHIPGSLLQVDPQAANKLLSDIHMSWMLGMKIVMVLGSSHDWDVCDLEAASMEDTKGARDARGTPYSLRQCYPARHPPQVSATSPPLVTNQETLRLLEEEAGFLRTEVERKINRYVQRTHIGGQRQLGGNVVSGNFYTATRLRLRSQDDNDDSMVQYTGYASQIHLDKISRILHDHNDVVLLTTVGQSRRGNVVNVNGHQLTAAVAASLQADKVIYMASEGCVLQQQQNDSSSNSAAPRMIQELPLSLAKSITNYHNVHVRRGKFATIQEEQDDDDDENEDALEPRVVELLLNLAWSSWAVENGVRRAHIVNPTDGALLEELFTSRNGANICLYHDDELLMNDKDDEEDDDDDAEELLWGDDDAGVDGGNNVVSPFSSVPPPPISSAVDFLEALRRKRRTKSNSTDSFQ